MGHKIRVPNSGCIFKSVVAASGLPSCVPDTLNKKMRESSSYFLSERVCYPGYWSA